MYRIAKITQLEIILHTEIIKKIDLFECIILLLPWKPDFCHRVCNNFQPTCKII